MKNSYRDRITGAVRFEARFAIPSSSFCPTSSACLIEILGNAN